MRAVIVLLDRGTIVHRASSANLRADPTALERHLGAVGKTVTGHSTTPDQAPQA